MKVKFKNHIKETLKKSYTSYTFAVNDLKNITYFKNFTEHDFFIVKDYDEYYYKIISPSILDSYYLYKGHVVPFDMMILDDKLFEWEGL